MREKNPKRQEVIFNGRVTIEATARVQRMQTRSIVSIDAKIIFNININSKIDEKDGKKRKKQKTK